MIIIDSIKKWWQKIKKEGISLDASTKKFIWGIIFFVIVSLIFTIEFIPDRIDLKPGEVSKMDVTAPGTISFVDQKKTEELKEIAANSAPKVYEEANEVNNKIEDEIIRFFDKIKIGKKIMGDSPEKLANNIIKNNNYKFSEKTIVTLLKSEDTKLEELKDLLIKLLDKQLEQHVLPGELNDVKDTLKEEVMDQNYDKNYRLALTDILINTIQPNMILNKEETEKRQVKARKQVEDVEKTVRQGEIIVRKGDVVTDEDIIILEKLGLQKPRINYLNIIGIIIIIITLILMAVLYLRRYKSEVWEDINKIVLLEMLAVFVLILAKIISIFQLTYLNYLVPVAAASILATVLIGSETALVMTIFLSIMVSLIFDNSFNVLTSGFIAGLVGIFSVSKLSQRSDLVRAGFYVSLVLIVFILGITIINPINNWVALVTVLAVGLVNGLLVAILANGLLPYIEHLFGLTSSVKLLELSNPSQPLLKRMLVEAPGTYHHSVIVGNLAEAAADDIGADSLLVRVGAYYHDIGKLKRPYFFTDNQFGGENPHNKLSANLSSLIIKSHVKDGVELAKEYKLPKSIIDIIKQHQGTNLISYFYQQAMEDSKHDNVEESDFRYDGPKPQSKEAAIIMLADIVEAAVRSKQFNKSNHNRIEGLVRELIREKLTEGQLDESDLTLKDLDIVVNSFVNVLTGIYHQRVEYPENIIK